MSAKAKEKGLFLLGVAICFGITIDTLVTLTALVVIWCMGLM